MCICHHGDGSQSAVCNNSAIQHLQVPVDKNSERKKAAATQFNYAKARMTTLMNWGHQYVARVVLQPSQIEPHQVTQLQRA